MYQLLSNDVEHAQELMWMDMDCSDHYPNYIAWDKLWKKELKRIKRLWQIRQYMQHDEIIANKYIPQDVKNAYEKFVNGVFDNKWLPYNILSKTDMKLYFFSEKNILLARQNTLIWKHIWDQKNIKTKSKTTPWWMYEINMKYRTDENGNNLFDRYDTHYITLYPLEWQYDYPNKYNYTIWIHWLYMPELWSRTDWLNSLNTNSHRMSGWCPNVNPDRFGGVYNQFKLWARLYITHEPN